MDKRVVKALATLKLEDMKSLTEEVINDQYLKLFVEQDGDHTSLNAAKATVLKHLGYINGELKGNLSKEERGQEIIDEIEGIASEGEIIEAIMLFDLQKKPRLSKNIIENAWTGVMSKSESYEKKKFNAAKEILQRNIGSSNKVLHKMQKSFSAADTNILDMSEADHGNFNRFENKAKFSKFVKKIEEPRMSNSDWSKNTFSQRLDQRIEEISSKHRSERQTQTGWKIRDEDELENTSKLETYANSSQPLPRNRPTNKLLNHINDMENAENESNQSVNNGQGNTKPKKSGTGAFWIAILIIAILVIAALTSMKEVDWDDWDTEYKVREIGNFFKSGRKWRY